MALEADVNGVRVAELVATLSYAADLGLGHPMEHCMRQTVIALRLADLVEAPEPDREATYYLGLLMNTYCHADAAEQAKWFGDDLTFKSDGIEVLGMSTPQVIAFLLRRVGSHGTPLDRARRLAAFPVAGPRQMSSFLTTHSSLGAQFAEQMGMDDAVREAMRQAYEQWDGKGEPEHLSGEEICLPARLVHLASPIEVFSRRHGAQAAIDMTRKNRGRQFDPAMVDAFCGHTGYVLDGLDDAAGWDAIIAAAPSLSRRVSGAGLDTVLEAMGDLVDLKSPYLVGHSRGVANLAAEAGRRSGLGEDAVTTLRRAGLLHDLGRLGVPNTVWDKAGVLTDAEIERVRLHPYLTDRMLARVPALARSRDIAARHHERLDGSGYPRGLTAASLSTSDRLLAAADLYHSLIEPRPYRTAMRTDQASAELRTRVRLGRLDGDAVQAVLAAAGHRAAARPDRAAGLTSREVEVLALLARGQANKQIGSALGVSPKTVSNHVEHIYAKLGVSSRAAAALYAARHGLVGAYEPA